jgi:hypothetical protein
MATKQPRKGGLSTVQLAAGAKDGREASGQALKGANMTTAINLPASMWELLRRVAFNRALKRGGRASVSAVLVDLVERNRRELEKELEKEA